MSAVDKVIATARKEIGYIEKASNSQLDSKTANVGSANFTKFARDLDDIGYFNGKKNGYAWCDVFVNWCFVETFGAEMAIQVLCEPGMKNGAASCTQSAKYYKNADRYYYSPKVGDQIFFGTNGGYQHTGLVVKVDSAKVYTIEGNTSAASGMVANGGCVREKSYALSYSRIMGYGRPKYELVEGSDYVPTTTTTQSELKTTAVDYDAKVTPSVGLRCRDYPVTGTQISKYSKGDIVHISKEATVDGAQWGYTGIGWISLAYVEKISEPTKEEPVETPVVEENTTPTESTSTNTVVNNMTPEEVKSYVLWVISDFLNTLGTYPVADWAKYSWDRVCNTEADDGNKLMDGTRPNSFVTRQELAAIIDRLGFIQ